MGPTVGPEFDGLRIEVEHPDAVVEQQEVIFRVTLTNLRSENYTMPQPHFDVFVLDRKGNVLWNFLYGAAVFGSEVIIPPGHEYEIDIVWNQEKNESGTVEPGEYRVLAVFFDLPPALVSERSTIVIN